MDPFWYPVLFVFVVPLGIALIVGLCFWVSVMCQIRRDKERNEFNREQQARRQAYARMENIPVDVEPPAGPSALTYDFFISNTQRSGQASTLAADLAVSLKEAGMRVWNSTTEGDKEAEERIRESANFIAVISGPCSNSDFPDDPPERNAYFSRPDCLHELSKAVVYKIPIQPVIRATDKREVDALLSHAPEEYQFVGKLDFITMERSDADYWEVGIEKIMRTAPNRAPRPPPQAQPPQPQTQPQPQAPLQQPYDQVAYSQPVYVQPAYVQPAQVVYGQPQYGQPQYAQPQYAQPYGQPAYTAYGYGQ